VLSKNWAGGTFAGLQVRACAVVLVLGGLHLDFWDNVLSTFCCYGNLSLFVLGQK